MFIEQRIVIHAPASEIFQIYSDVGRWKEWDLRINEFWLDGPFQAGTTGFVTLSRGGRTQAVLTTVVEHRSFSFEMRIHGVRVKFDHELVAVASGTCVVHRIKLTGLMSIVLGSRVAGRVGASLPQTLVRLKYAAESAAKARAVAFFDDTVPAHIN